MTDDDKSGRHGKSWAERIPLVTLLAIVFAAGGVFVKQQFVDSKIGGVVDRFERYATSSEARLRSVEDWRIQVETEKTAAARIEKERLREERERKRPR